MAGKRKGKKMKRKSRMCDGVPSRLVQKKMGPSSSHQLLNDKSILFS
jgi:hypothetical protein